MESVIKNLDNSLNTLAKSNKDADKLNDTLSNEMIFDVLPESTAVQKTFKLKQILEPRIENDLKTVKLMLEHYEKKRDALSKQNQVFKIRLDESESSVQ